jgi:hypothetical protein
MFSAEQYRAKAAEFRTLLTNMRRSPNETTELSNLEQTYTTLAENEEWMAINIDNTIQHREGLDNRTSPAEEKHILTWAGGGILSQGSFSGSLLAPRGTDQRQGNLIIEVERT